MSDAQTRLIEGYKESGLSEYEISLLTAPFTNLNDTQRFEALRALDKHTNYNYSIKLAERQKTNEMSEEERIQVSKPAIWTEGKFRGN